MRRAQSLYTRGYVAYVKGAVGRRRWRRAERAEGKPTSLSEPIRPQTPPETKPAQRAHPMKGP